MSDNLPRWFGFVGLTLIILGFVGLVVEITDITWTFLLIDIGPGIGGWIGVVLLLYYGRLLVASQSQAKAARASYAPNLDVSTWPYERDAFVLSQRIKLRLVNQGEGTAKNISISLKFRDEPHQYSANINQSLRPGQQFNNLSPTKDSPSDSFSLEPQFRFENNEGLMEGELLNYLEYLENNGNSGPYYAWIEVRWTDIIEDQQYIKRNRIQFPSPSSTNKQAPEPPQPSGYAGTITIVSGNLKSRVNRKFTQFKKYLFSENDQSLQKFIFREDIDLHPVSDLDPLK